MTEPTEDNCEERKGGSMTDTYGLLGIERDNYVSVHFRSDARGKYADGRGGEVYPYPDINGEILDCNETGVLIQKSKFGFRDPEKPDIVYQSHRFRVFVPWSSIFQITLDIESETPTEEALDLDLRAVEVLKHIALSKPGQAIAYAKAYLEKLKKG